MPLLGPTAILELGDFLPHRLMVLVTRLNRALARDIEDRFGLATSDWRCMAVLGRHGDISGNELADRSGLDKVSVSRAVSRLVERELVNRAVDANDRRAVSLTLTPAGRDVYEQVTKLALQLERRLVGALGLSELRALERVLTKLEQAASRLEDQDLAQVS